LEFVPTIFNILEGGGKDRNHPDQQRAPMLVPRVAEFLGDRLD